MGERERKRFIEKQTARRRGPRYLADSWLSSLFCCSFSSFAPVATSSSSSSSSLRARARYYCCRRCRVSKEASADSARKGKIRKMGHWLLGARGDPERIIHVYVCICIFNAVIIAALLLGADREPSHYILYILLSLSWRALVIYVDIYNDIYIGARALMTCANVMTAVYVYASRFSAR